MWELWYRKSKCRREKYLSQCGLSCHRDIHAARNILLKHISLLNIVVQDPGATRAYGLLGLNLQDQDGKKRKKIRNMKMVKRVGQRTPTKKNEIYVASNSIFASLLKRATTLLNSEKNQELVIIGVGATIEKALNLSLKLKRSFLGLLSLNVYTKTVHFYDDLEPLDEDGIPQIQKRNNSCVEIKLKKIA